MHQDTLNNVRLIIFTEFGDERRTIDIADSIERQSLINKLSSKEIKFTMESEDAEVCLSYKVDNTDVVIGLANYTSDVESEHYEFYTYDNIVLASVWDDIDYASDYNETRIYFSKIGDYLSQDDYLCEIRK